jgi:Flp pilus assembly protein TadD
MAEVLRRLCLGVLVLAAAMVTQAHAAAGAARPGSSGSVAAATPDAAQGRSLAAALEAGRKLCREERWGEAVSASAALLLDDPDDARTLSELGWAAFNAGDFRKATTVLERSVALARTPAVKAASLYSLGRLEEASGRRDVAAHHDRASLALRRSEEAELRLRALPDERPEPLPVAAADEEPFCSEPRPLEDICACALAHLPAVDVPGWPDGCAAPVASLPAHFRLVSARTALLLLEEADAGWRVVAVLDRDHRPVTPESSELRWNELNAGGHRVLTFTTREMDFYHSGMTGPNPWCNESWHGTGTICLSTPGAPTRCPVHVPLLDESKSTFLDDSAEAQVHRDGHTLGLDVGDDGVAQVVLETGVAPDRRILGPRRLW